MPKIQLDHPLVISKWVMVQPGNEENIIAPHYWAFVMGIQRWLVDSPHKGPVIYKAFPCLYVITDLLVSRLYEIAGECGYNVTSLWHKYTFVSAYGWLVTSSAWLSKSMPRHIRYLIDINPFVWHSYSAMSYGCLIKPSLWDNNNVPMSYGWGTKSSVWDSVGIYVIPMR